MPHVLKNVKVYWAAISKPNTKYDPQWLIECEIPEDDKANRAVLEDAGILDKLRDDKEGREPFIKIKRKCTTKDGKARQAPDLVDAKKNPTTVSIGNGSVCNVSFAVYDTKAFGKSVKGVDLRGVQIIHLEPVGNETGFEEADGFVAEGVAEEAETESADDEDATDNAADDFSAVA